MDSEVSKLFPAALLSSCTAEEMGRKVRPGQGGPQEDILFASVLLEIKCHQKHSGDF